MITLETARLILRMFLEDDLEPYAKICAASPENAALARGAPPRLSSASGRTFVFDRS